MEPVRITTGPHKLSVVLSDPVTGEVHRAVAETEVPEVPRNQLFVIGPYLGRRAGTDILLRSDGSTDGDTAGRQNSFQLLVDNRIDGAEDLLALTQVCRIVSKKRPATSEDDLSPMVHRVLLAADGEILGRLPEVPLELEETGKVRCQNLLDLLPSASLEAGEYAFRAYVGSADGDEQNGAEVSFEIGAALASH